MNHFTCRIDNNYSFRLGEESEFFNSTVNRRNVSSLKLKLKSKSKYDARLDTLFSVLKYINIVENVYIYYKYLAKLFARLMNVYICSFQFPLK